MYSFTVFLIENARFFFRKTSTIGIRYNYQDQPQTADMITYLDKHPQ